MIRTRHRKWNLNATPGKILFPNRIRILTFAVYCIFGIIFLRLLQLQIVYGVAYTEKIKAQVSSETEISARRGDILVRDPRTGTLIKLALNTSLDELRVDAKEIPDKRLVADILGPIVFEQIDYEACLKDLTLCPEGSVTFPTATPNPETGEVPELLPIIAPFEEALNKKKEEIYQKISTDNRYVLIKRRLTPEQSATIRDLQRKYSVAHKKDRARLFAEKKDKDLAVPDYFKGVILESKPLRYYPEGELASQIIGFVNHSNTGQYGIEEKMNTVLSGQKGLYSGPTDTLGRSIGLSLEDFQKAIDGSDVVLTIDRIIQQKVEEVLNQAVKEFRADAGQVIIMNPKNGFILAMANAPGFDPNEFGNVYLRRRTTPEDVRYIYHTTPLFKKNPLDPTGELLPATFEEFELGWELGFDPEFYIYENFTGPAAYLNKAVQEIYEPGSVFKPLVMSIALDNNEVKPSTQYFEEKPIEVDVGGKLVPIHNADKKYLGWQTMTNVLERSANLGMIFVSKKLGKGVMHDYLKNFGFGSETYIELADENPGMLIYYTKWSTAALYNHAFGQGISTTPLQVITAWCALANGGLMPEPHIIAEIHHPDGTIEKTEPRHKSVLKADTAATITAMLISAVENGVARKSAIPGYKVAGKTGTSQIARTDGVGYESAATEGHIITGFVGYAPAEDPKFIILVKFDRPRFKGENTWGENTTAPVFKQIAEFLFDYYGIPPESE